MKPNLTELYEKRKSLDVAIHEAKELSLREPTILVCLYVQNKGSIDWDVDDAFRCMAVPRIGEKIIGCAFDRSKDEFQGYEQFEVVDVLHADLGGQYGRPHRCEVYARYAGPLAAGTKGAKS